MQIIESSNANDNFKLHVVKDLENLQFLIIFLRFVEDILSCRKRLKGIWIP